MSIDYNKIRDDNMREYGQGTRHLSFLGRLYTDRTHFIFELLQNAEDASASRILFTLFEDRLEMAHDGRPFNEDDVRGVCGVGEGKKSEDLTQIGKFGIGFKSVYAYTTKPKIYSGGESFRVEHYVRPYAVEPRSTDNPWTTLFDFEFDVSDLDPKTACEEIGKCLRNLSARTLLFLRKIKEIAYKLPDAGGVYLREETAQGSARKVEVIGQNNDQEENERWLIFNRPVPGPAASCEVLVEFAFCLEPGTKDKKERIVKIGQSPLVVYFPTEKDTKLGFLIQGPYRTTPARDNISRDDEWNKQLIRETAELVAESLQQLKEMGLLSVSLLETLPIRFEDNWRYRYDRETALREFYKEFYPIFSRVRETLRKEELLPASDGTFVAARNAKLVRGAALMKMLNQEQLGTFFQSDDDIKWLSDEITQNRTPDLRSYLMNELNVEEFTPEVFAGKLSAQFFAGQDDEWFIKLYAFLSDQKVLWRPPLEMRGLKGDTEGILRNKPILRLQDGTHVNPFRHDGSPNAYLAVGEDTDTSSPIVKVTISSHSEARQFLVELGIEEIDLVAEVIDKALPKYRHDSVGVETEENRHDLKKIEQAYKTDSQEKQCRLRGALLRTPFILAYLSNEERTAYRKPDQVYFEIDELCGYFRGNKSFAYVGLDHPQAELFKNIGVKESISVHRKQKDGQGYVVIKESWGRHERGHQGFDPDIRVDGLECAISTPTVEKSTYIWNRIAVPNSDCIRGTVEKSNRQTFQGSRTESRMSGFGNLLTDHAWLPDSNGNLYKPSDLTLDDLDGSFVRDEKLADQLGMKKNVISKLAEEAGISKTALDRARQIAAASPEVQQQIDSLLKKKERSQGNRNSNPYHEALSEAFSAPGRGKSSDGGGNGGLSQDSGRRREKIQEDIAASIENEGEHGQQFSFALRKKWKRKNDQVKVAFGEWYGGRCQICDKTFTQKNGEPYFEGVYLVSRTTAGWLDREGNVLCLCAQHSAMFQFGPKEADDIVQQVMQLKVKAEGGDRHPAIRMKLCGDPIAIRYAEKHLIDLQEMVKVAQESGT